MSRSALSFSIALAVASCNGATEPREPVALSYSDSYGTWAGTDNVRQVNLEIRQGASHQECYGLGKPCVAYSALDYRGSFADASTGYSGDSTGTFETGVISVAIWGIATGEHLAYGEAEFALGSTELPASDVTSSAFSTYAFRGKLRTVSELVGEVIVRHYGEPPINLLAKPVSVQRFVLTLSKQ